MADAGAFAADAAPDLTAPSLVVGVVGAGLMGRGIAQVAVQAGIPVRLFDTRPGAAADARAAILQTLAHLASRGKIPADQSTNAPDRLAVADSLAVLSSCGLVIEAIVESLPAKQALFRDLEQVVAPDCVLATNTSSLLVTEVAAGCRHPERVGGLHFFSPVPRMKIAEVIPGMCSAPWLGNALTAFVHRLGHAPVLARDTPGFIANHASRGYQPEALRLVGEGIAGTETIDDILRDACGFRMGPFELFDLTGLDISHPAGESIYRQFFDEPRFQPSILTRQRLAGGMLGRKTGQGFYRYDADGVRQPLPPVQTPAITPVPLWVAPSPLVARQDVMARIQASGAALETTDRPSGDALCIVLPVGEDATVASLAHGLDARRVVALDPLFMTGRLTLMLTPLTRPDMRDQACAVFGAGATPVAVIQDSPGFVAQRVCASIVNNACAMAQQGVASPADIDRTVMLALAYPLGPFALGDRLGAATILQILDALQARYREPRYRPSPWLSRRAQLGVSLATLPAA